MRRPAGLACLILVAAGATRARADTVTTTEGTVLEGKVVSQDEESVVIETTFDGTKSLPRSSVKAIDASVPPLREQLEFRIQQAAGDAPRLWEVHKWAVQKGFKEELIGVLEAIVTAKPADRRAHRLLGHEEVDGRWMTPEEKVAYLAEKEAEAMTARGLVLFEGRWVTPQEKGARERGLVPDGPDWVTEEEYHRRRGEVRRGDGWVRAGEEEGRAFVTEAARASGVALQHLWGPHFDIAHDGMPEVAAQVLAAAESSFGVLRSLLKPEGQDLPETAEARVRIVLFKKQPAYARFAKWFDEKVKANELVPGWARAVQKQHAWWWAHPEKIVGVYQFPNPDRTVVSNAVHNLGLVLITRYRLNFEFPSVWFQEGFAYLLEMETLKFTESFTLGRAPATPGATGQAAQPGAEGEPPAWNDSAKWPAALRLLVAEGRDPPLKRLAQMTGDQMGYEELVKSWSVVDFLRRWDAGKFKAFVDGWKRSGTAEEDALRAAYDAGYLEVDRRWRAWVSGGFGTP